MQRFILFTKTKWDEPPRLRHQFAELLAAAGHEVLFFEKPTSIGRVRRDAIQRAPNITSVQHRELLHHKLRLTPILHHANAAVTIRSIARRFQETPITPGDVVISFNYDYWFLRRLFPDNHIITVINDDFICVALFGYAEPLLWALERSCAHSNRVLTVSVPLQRQLKPYCDPELFLPWADRPYREPQRSARRDTLLFWGYVNQRIDFKEVGRVADNLLRSESDIRLLFVGPIVGGFEAEVAKLEARANVRFLPSTKLDDLPLERVLAAYIPYRPFDPEVDAITLSNKALSLLARGLPLLIPSQPAMPNFTVAPFVERLDTTVPARQLELLRASFEGLQSSIANFVSANGAEARLRQLVNGKH